MSSRKTTIFKQLILNVVIPTLLALLIFTAINFKQTVEIIKKSNTERDKLLTHGIKNVLLFQDVALDLIDREVTIRLKELGSAIINMPSINASTLESIDLKSVARKLEMDLKYEDIYLINKDGKIVNTTFELDLGLNLFELGNVFKKYLKDIMSSGEFVSDRFAIEHKTKRAKKYCYQPSPDGKYIVEIGAYSNNTDDILKTVEDAKDSLKSSVAGIIDIEIFIMSDEPFTLNKNPKSFPDQEKNLIKAFNDSSSITSYDKKIGKSWINYQYRLIERSDSKDQAKSKLFRGTVIRIVSDRTSQKTLLRNELMKFTSVFILTILIVSVLIFRKIRIITNPIQKLVKSVELIAKGNLHERAEVVGNNEFTTLAEQFNQMILNIENKNEILLNQKNELEGKNQEITSSIEYAKYIQSSILPRKESLDEYLKDYFILFKPRDIVSGDFYWVSRVEENIIIAAVDCTGHGVPGAFMSILGAAFLTEIVTKEYITHPGVVLRRLRKEVINSMQQRGESGEQKDGMDIALCSIDFDKKKLQFAGANNPLYLIRKKGEPKLNYKTPLSSDDFTFYEIKGDKMPISINDTMDNFSRHEIDLTKGDLIYIFSDGYADQFGGPSGKKFMYKHFRQLLMDNSSKPMSDQKIILERTLTEWQGNFNQIDDILIIGIRIN